MVVGKAGHLFQVLVVDISEQLPHFEQRRVPDVVDDAGESRRIVGEVNVVRLTGVIRRLEAPRV